MLKRSLYFLSLILAVVLSNKLVLTVDLPNPQAQKPLKFALVADKDKKTLGEKFWFETVLKLGSLVPSQVSPGNQPRFSLSWEKEILLKSRFSNKNRGLELSDLVFWRGSLWSICDSTGLLYELVPKTSIGAGENCFADYLQADVIELVPKLILTDDGGESTLPAKNEWIAVVGDQMFIGGHGREWTEDGVIMGRGGEWVKVIQAVPVPPIAQEYQGSLNASGNKEALVLSFMDWHEPYQAMRAKLGASFPGYVSHESAEWWDNADRWVFFPRKISQEGPYSDESDETNGNTHQFLTASSDFSSIKLGSIDSTVDNDFGVSGIRSVPGHDGVFVVLRVIEKGSDAATDLDVVSLATGQSLLDAEHKTASHGHRVTLSDGNFAKFEGVEFLP